MGNPEANDPSAQPKANHISVDLQRYSESLEKTNERLRHLEGEWLAAIARMQETRNGDQREGTTELEAYIELLCKEFRIVNYRAERIMKARNNAEKMLDLFLNATIKEHGRDSHPGC